MAVFLNDSDIGPAKATLLCGIAGVVLSSIFYSMNTTINYLTFPTILLASSVPHLNRQWQEIYFRGHHVGPALAIIGGTVFSTASYLADQGFAKQVFAAATVSSFAIIPYTLFFMVSTNDELHRRSFAIAKDPLTSDNMDETETAILLSKWLSLNKTRAKISLLSACLGTIVRIYSLTNFKLLSTITGGHKRSVRTAAWKPHISGESVLATGSFDATVGIWRRWDNYGTNTTEDHTNLTDDGLVDADADAEDEEWRFAVLLDGHDSEVKSVSWSPSGMLLATCARDKSIWIWEDLDDGDNNFETVAVMQEHGGDVKCVSWHPVEECLASAGYDDTIRLWREDLDDWGQVACIKGHGGDAAAASTAASAELQRQWREQVALSGPRLVTCSDDRTARIWRRVPKESASAAALSSAATGIPSIIRPTGTDENWEEDALLPHAHELAIYAVAWSRRTGIISSVGADGRIVLYEERFVEAGPNTSDAGAGADADAMDTTDDAAPSSSLRTEWSIVAVVDGAHGIYEINHAAWAKRADRGSESTATGTSEEEVLVTTADDGSVKVWSFQR
ncbi:hypothetical protein N7481_002780 [Penicillium waksmanii]|uniref:uncharacterized protein n=1 Tax=Penicillium waksmanii TaxID=69791 RepID=UPI002548BC54|nr:uncharacterized protein N7481_002780 [Penicillium waksmanii]KAJ5995803.1 hypothetical protein N7481_002780 [Penicillium waksmanii]